jgi:hypothetical protein
MSFIEDILDSSVSAKAKIIAIAICRYRNRKTGLCCPSLQLLSENLDLSQNAIQGGLKELCDAKILKIERIRKFTSNINSYIFMTENKALPKIDASDFDASKSDASNIDASSDTSFDASSDTSIHTSESDYKPIKPREPRKPIEHPLPPSGDGDIVCDDFLNFQSLIKSLGDLNTPTDITIQREVYSRITESDNASIGQVAEITHRRCFLFLKNLKLVNVAKPDIVSYITFKNWLYDGADPDDIIGVIAEYGEKNEGTDKRIHSWNYFNNQIDDLIEKNGMLQKYKDDGKINWRNSKKESA